MRTGHGRAASAAVVGAGCGAPGRAQARSSTGVSLGDDAGVRAAYAAHGGELYRFALRSVGEQAGAEDAVQETFLRAWRASARFDPTLGSLRGWLFAILRNVIIDQSRARSARPALSAEAATKEAVVDGEIDAVLLSWQVEEGLRRLSEEHRVAIVETYYRARPAAEVATELGVAVGTVRSRIYYGLKALRLALDEMGWEA